MTELLRHTLATTAYRFQNALYEANDDFGNFEPGNEVKTPAKLINHMSNVIAYAISIVRNEQRQDIEAGDFQQETSTFIKKLKELDESLLNREVTVEVAKRIFQGPVSDVLTHVGQLAMMRRLNGQPIKGINYSKAPVETGKFEYFS